MRFLHLLGYLMIGLFGHSQLLEVDHSFGDQGLAILPAVQNYSQLDAAEVLVGPQDEVFTVGLTTSSDNIPHTVITKYSAEGSLDTSYAQNGVGIYEVLGHSDYIRCGSIQLDGKVIAVGNRNDPTLGRSIFAMRANADGSLDTTFGNGGYSTYVPTSGYWISNDVKMLSDGRVVILSIVGNGTHILCLTQAGEPDPNFGNNGVTYFDLNGTSINGWKMDVDPSDRIVVGGRVGSALHPTGFGITRILPTGVLDQSFGVDGHFHLDIYPDDQFTPAQHAETLTDVACNTNGDIFIFGLNQMNILNNRQIGIWKIDHTGTLNTTFGTQGATLTLDTATNKKTPRSLIIQNDQVIAFGPYAGANAPFQAWLLQLNSSTGQPVNSNSSDPFMGLSTFNPTSINRVNSGLAMQANGRVLATVGVSNGPEAVLGLSKVISTTTGLDDVTSTPNARVFPNPATSSFSITDPSLDLRSVELYDMLGKRHIQYSPTANYALPANLNSGKYFVRLLYPDRSEVMPIIIER